MQQDEDNLRAAGIPSAAGPRDSVTSADGGMTPATVAYYSRPEGGGCAQRGQHPCSGCSQRDFTSHHLCGWCRDSVEGRERQEAADREKWDTFRSGNAILPSGKSFVLDKRGAFTPFGRHCPLNQPSMNDVCPPGMHACKVDVNTWTCMPNNVPCAVAINDYFHGSYINDIYETNRSQPYGFNNVDSPAALPARVMNPYQPGWVSAPAPLPAPPASSSSSSTTIVAPALDAATVGRLWQDAQYQAPRS